MPVTNKPHRAIATLKLPRNMPALITYASQIVNSMTGNAYFPTPTPPIASVQTAIHDLMAAQTDAQARTKGAVALRNEKRQTLVTLLEETRTYVQTTADTNPENGPSIIESSGIAVRKPPVLAPRGFRVKPGAVSGSVKVVAPSAARRASYEWEYSLDGGKTWVALPPTLQAKTAVSGLTPQTTVQFRYRAVSKTGATDWNPAIAFLVQ
jgi:hypothetical protein